MRHVKGWIALLASLLATGCGSMPMAYSAMIPVAAVGYVLHRGDVLSGSVRFSDVTLTKLDTSHPNQATIRVDGHLTFEPARIAGDDFANLGRMRCRIRLTNAAGDQLTEFRVPVTLAESGFTLTAVPADRPVRFTVTREISRNVWDLVAGAEIVDIHGL